MKLAAALVLVVLVTATQASRIDWSQVKPIEEFEHYWSRLPAEFQALRDVAVSDRRIVGGQQATPGQFPYQVALLSDHGTGWSLCGATILTQYSLLTAAHRVLSSSGGALALGGLAVLGAHNYSAWETTQQNIDFFQSGIRVHPNYNQDTIRNDIATVRLSVAAVFNTRVQPIALPASSDARTFAGMEGTASGFGRLSDSSTTPSDLLYYTRNPILSNAQCNTYWSTASVDAQNVCLDPTGGRSACNGDSGGPLTVSDTTGSTQVGIASFVSARGGASGAPSVWVRISYFRDWIQQNSDYVFRA
ncbi:brachyurin-like [Anopheles aquasalis]|uniref:brachyurin-like n=1 Tax=Anopheles aquasalis TaxID=42839 RepID=UPI00215A86FA|nr:brachyurin-like [Anopheles aquasalis]